MSTQDSGWKEEFRKKLEDNFIQPSIDSNGDIFLQNKYDDGDGNSEKTLIGIIEQLIQSERDSQREKIMDRLLEMSRNTQSIELLKAFEQLEGEHLSALNSK